MHRRQFASSLCALALGSAVARVGAQGLAGITEAEAGRGVKGALEKGALAAVQVLGRPDGFLGNPQVRIPLPASLQSAAGILRAFGQGRQVEELETAMNRAAENAVPLAKKLLVDAVKTMSVTDARNILGGGETSVTDFFAQKTRDPLGVAFLPAVRQATSQVDLAQKYDRIAQKGVAFGLVRAEDASIDHYVTRKALDGLYFMIGEEEKKIRRDPLGSGSALLGKVFGALR